METATVTSHRDTTHSKQTQILFYSPFLFKLSFASFSSMVFVHSVSEFDF